MGFDLQRLTPSSNPDLQLLKALDRFQVDLVLDVGANAGQFGGKLLSAGYKGRLVSFEPLSGAHEALSRVARRSRSWIVHSRTAIGNYDGATEINIAGNSVSSSLLPMTEAHFSAQANSAYVGTESVPIATLDSVVPHYLGGAGRPFLKIDAQGFEWQILDGARTTLPKVQGVLCELSLVVLYEGQHLWLETIKRLEDEGFVLWAIQKGFTDSRDGRTLQVNAVFFRT